MARFGVDDDEDGYEYEDFQPNRSSLVDYRRASTGNLMILRKRNRPVEAQSPPSPSVFVVPAPPPPPEFKPRSYFPRYLFLLAFAVFLWALYDGPPAPPDASGDWSDYLAVHTHQLWTSGRALFWDTPVFVTGWLLRQVVSEVRFRSRTHHCPVRLTELHFHAVVGYERTVARFQDALRQEQYVVWATGEPHVGKHTLLKELVGKMWYSQCPDWKYVTVSRGRSASEVYQQVHEFVDLGGRVVVVENMESVDREALEWLLDWAPRQKVLCYLISEEMGIKAAALSLRDPSLLLDLKDEFEEYVGRRVPDLVALPFGPLRQADLGVILRRQFEERSRLYGWKSLSVSDAAVESLLGVKFIEYWSWKSQGEYYSTDGARPLLDVVWPHVQAQWRSCDLARASGDMVVDLHDSLLVLKNCTVSEECDVVCLGSR